MPVRTEPRRTWSDATQRELTAAALALNVSGAVRGRTFADVRADLEALDPDAAHLNPQAVEERLYTAEEIRAWLRMRAEAVTVGRIECPLFRRQMVAAYITQAANDFGTGGGQ